MILLLTGPLVAAQTWEVGALAEAPRLDFERPAYGVMAAAGFGPERWQLELAASGASANGTPLVRIRPQARIWLWDPLKPSLSPVVSISAAPAFDPDVHMHVAAGLDFDPGRGPGLRPRLGGTYIVRIGPEWSWSLGFRVGVAWHRKPDTPVPAPPPIPDLAGALVWMPTPVCEWMPPEDAALAMSRLDAAPAIQSVGASSDATDAVSDEASASAVPTGDLVLFASPGEELVVGGEPLPVEDNYAYVTRPEGETMLVVTGGGRVAETPLVVTAGATSWIRVPGPSPASVPFAVGSATLDPEARAELEAFTQALGGWGVEVRGSYSEEGDRRVNRELAAKRAEAVQAVLVELGVAEDRIKIGHVFMPDPGADRALQRTALLRPLVAR